MNSQDQIIAYLLDELPDEEKQEFEVSIQQNPTLEKETQVYEDIIFAIKNRKDIFAFRSLIQSLSSSKTNLKVVYPHQSSNTRNFVGQDHSLTPLEKDRFKFNKKRRRQAFLYLSIAASFIIICFLGNLNFQKSTFSPDELFNSFYVAPGLEKLPTVAKSELVNGTYESQKIYNSAIQFYINNNPDSALLLLEDVSLYYPEGSQYLKGLCYLELKDFGKSIGHLKTSDQSGSIWYLALAYLGNHQLEESIRLLNQIAESPSIYQSEATLLLEEIKSYPEIE